MQAITTLLVVCLTAATYAVPTGRIVGGTDAPEGKYPYQVALKLAGSLHCGGSIISKRYVLTAAHCLRNQVPSRLTVHAGTVYLNKDRYVYASEKLIIHERYNHAAILNDIGLVRVAKDIEFNEFVQPIPLVSHNNAKDGDRAVLTGWGRLGVLQPIPNHLQQINLNVKGIEKCAITHPGIANSQICTLTKAGEGACNGDSGGPLVANGAQIGIVSYGRPCARGYPDVFTRVYFFLDWIKAHQE